MQPMKAETNDAAPLGANVVPIDTTLAAANDSGGEPGPVERVATSIEKQWAIALGAERIAPDRGKIARILQGVFWSGRSSKLYLLNDKGGLIQFREKEAGHALSRRFGRIADHAKLKAACSALAGSKGKGKPIGVADLVKIAHDAIVREAMFGNQREAVAWYEDVWASCDRIDLDEDVAHVVLRYRPVGEAGRRDDALLADYKLHFPELDDLLCVLVAARFARDRRKAYLWIHATSGWGKDFLSGVFQSLGLVVETSEREIARAMRGEPVGLQPEAFKRASVLLVNEFHTVTGEIKQLERELRLSPKNQLQSRVPLYLKLLTSAESVESLVTDSGVEDQFAERVSYLEAHGRLDDRVAYQRDQGAYFDAVLWYVSTEYGRLVQEMLGMGREMAERTAALTLGHYHELWGIGKRFGTLTDSLAELAVEFREWVAANVGTRGRRYEDRDLFEEDDGRRKWLKNAPRLLDQFITDSRAKSQWNTLRVRKDDILAAVSVNGQGNARQRYTIEGKETRARKVLWEQD